MSEQIKTMFSEIAPTYDKANHLLSMKKDIQWRKDSILQMLEGGFKPTKVLDLCAGTGDFAQAVKEQVPDAQVFLADFAKPMLLLAKEKVMSQPGVGLLAADALKLPFQDMTFDAVVCGFGVRNLDSSEAGLKEIARILKPGGKAVVLEFFKPVNPLLRLIYAIYISVIVPLLGGAVSKNKKAYSYLPDSAKRFNSVDEFKQLMETCGFKNVDLESKTLGIAVSVMGTRK